MKILKQANLKNKSVAEWREITRKFFKDYEEQRVYHNKVAIIEENNVIKLYVGDTDAII